MSDQRAAASPATADAPAAATESFYYVSGEDDVRIRVSELALGQSATIHGMISNLGYTEEQAAATPIQLKHIKGAILQMVMDWCEHHKGEPIPVEDTSIPKQVNIPEWDQKMLDGIDNEKLFDLIMAANYLDVKQLLNYCCKQVAMMIKGKSPEEIREIYMIPTDEEDAAAEKEAKERAKKEAAAAIAGQGPSTSTA
ncbi:hypothetical protein L3Y34_000326 [Caenorhabditis briggsae]|uniref:Skp1-related protein n=1 Tax=Caenorhabditis briggsae TaxID=6238 RepID=A0AAE9D926_CAEBR|nr:hypothetical protein L3Y34_000326 [Caenorhabditis briggsae]